MTALESFKKYKTFPSTLIVNGLSPLGVQIAYTLLEQKGLVIITDKYTKENKAQIDKLSQFESFTFINLTEKPVFLDKIKRLDYLVYLDHNSLDINLELSPNDFLRKINVLDTFLKFATDRKSKVLLTTSLKTHQYSISEYSKKKYTPTRPAYSNVEQQRYEEKLLFNFNKKYNLDARIIRLGDIYGPGCDIEKDSTINILIKQALKSKSLKIYGDGLEENYIIHLNDATYGLVKALFAQNTNGEIFNLTNFEDNTTLAIAYALIETPGKAREVKFLEEKEKLETAPIDSTPNLSKVGWKPRIDLTKGLTETIAWLREDSNAKKEIKRGRGPAPMNGKEHPKTSRISAVFGKLWKKIVDFFFETDTQLLLQKSERPKGILDKLSKETVDKKRVSIKKDLYKKVKKPRKKKVQEQPFWKKISRDFRANKSKAILVLAISAVIYFLFFEPIVGFFGNAVIAGVNGYKAVEYLKENDFENFGNQLEKVESPMTKAQKSLERTSWIFRLVGASESSNGLIQFISATRHLVRGGLQSSDLISSLSEYARNFTFDTEAKVNYTSYMESIYLNTNSFDLTYIELLKADEILNQINYDKLPMLSSLKGSVTLLREELMTRINSYKDYISILPTTLGYPDEKTYLIIFQNYTELRSTGGFIGSYGVLRMDNGRIAEITIDDIYNPDGQLDTFVEPPAPLKVILGEESWSMRDSNWEPDFPTAARQIEWFYKLETGREVDGVIAINTSIIEKLLELTGPIYLPEEKVTVSAENFFDEAEKHHLTFTPGSMAKRDFLVSLTQALLEEVGQKDYQFLTEAGKLVEELLNSREIFIYLNDPKAQRVITNSGWDGSIKDYSGDFLFPVENNLGGDKVNRYIEREISDEITISEENVDHNLTISYTNNSKTSEWPGGNYKNYLSLFLPQNSYNIKSTGIETAQTDDRYNYKEISGIVHVPHNSSEKAKISYSSLSVEDLPVNKRRYSLYLQRQSGIEETYINFSIEYPKGWIIVKVNSPLSSREDENTISFYGLQNADIEIVLEFSTDQSPLLLGEG